MTKEAELFKSKLLVTMAVLMVIMVKVMVVMVMMVMVMVRVAPSVRRPPSCSLQLNLV